MTLQQLRYIITIAESGTLSEASRRLFISQPSLSQSLKDLEDEISLQIFHRSNKGLLLSHDGEEFLSYARQVVLQYQLVEDKYINNVIKKNNFAVSTQHYSFAVKAFINTVKHYNGEDYEFAIRETKTHEIIDDVKTLRSEIGILYLNQFNKMALSKLFSDYNITFHKLFDCKIFVYLRDNHPLLAHDIITMEMLQDYPCLAFEQGNHNSLFFAEEVLSSFRYKQTIRANDRGTMLNLMDGLDGFTLCSGIIASELNGNKYVAVPLDSDETMTIGYIKKANLPLSDLAKEYREELLKTYQDSVSFNI